MVDILASEGEVSVQSNEYTLVNDNLYASVNASQTPEWLLALIDNEVAKSIARGFKDYDLLVQNVVNAVSSLDEAEASYVTLTGFNTLVNGIVASRLEALTAQYDGVYATKTEVTNLIATSEQASAQNISELSANLNNLTDAKITNVQNVIATTSSAIAEDITTLAASIEDNLAEIENVRTTVVTDTSALAEEITTLTTEVNNNASEIQNVRTAAASDNSALAQEVTTLSSVVSNNTSEIQNVRSSAASDNSALAEEITTLTATVNDNTSEIASVRTASTTATSALAEDIQSLAAEVEGNTAEIAQVRSTASSDTEALAQEVTTLTTTVGENEAKVVELAQSVDGIGANWGIETDVNGHVAGIKLLNNEGSPSRFTVSTEVFEVINPNTGDVLIGTSPAGHPTVDANTLGGVSVQEVLDDLDGIVVDFNEQNNRDASPVSDPTVLTNGTTIDHTLNSDGSADISFEWGWSGNEGTLDGFTVLHYQSKVNTTHTFGNDPNNETTYMMPANARSFVLRGVSADSFHSFGVVAYRKVDRDLAPNSVITSNIVSPSSNEYPYRPSQQIAFSGDIIGTIDGSSASSVKNNAYNGATFTNSDAGLLAYYNTVSTVFIEDLAVNRLKIAGESAGILRFAEGSNSIYGTANNVYAMGLYVSIPEPATVLLQLSFQQVYNTSSGVARTSFSLDEGNSGQTLVHRSISVVNDTPCVTVAYSASPGTKLFRFIWNGENNSVRVTNRTITAYVSLR